MKQRATIIIPCAGRSSRFPQMRPKFLLVNPRGTLMAVDAISKLDLKGCRLIVSVLAEHEAQYGVRRIFKKFFPKLGVEVCVLPASLKSQAGDVHQTLGRMGVKGPFLIKDSDNIFKLEKVAETFNYVAVERLENVGLINARNKSYVAADTSGLITSIEEKKVISNTFSVGGYYFLDPEAFSAAFRVLAARSKETGMELYVSRVISYLMLERKAKFKEKPVSEYVDLGTAADWFLYKQRFKSYFLDLDGILVSSSSEYFEPQWGTTPAIEENAAVVRRLHAEGAQIIITTSRKEEYRAATARQLKKARIPYDALLMGLYHAERVVVNDFSGTNPHPSARAVNLPRDSRDLGQYLDR